VVIMGGATAFGNTTPAAEFNFLADPEGAEAVLQSGAQVTLCPLDVTHRAYLTEEDLAAVAALGSPQAKAAARLMAHSAALYQKTYRLPGAAMHDPCAMMAALRPQLFRSHHCWAGVETGGKVSRGRLVTDAFSDAKGEPNCTLITDLDRTAFVQSMLDILARYGEG
jgi:inosine-uridine nucleoside N-ribohydrolase